MEPGVSFVADVVVASGIDPIALIGVIITGIVALIGAAASFYNIYMTNKLALRQLELTAQAAMTDAKVDSTAKVIQVVHDGMMKDKDTAQKEAAHAAGREELRVELKAEESVRAEGRAETSPGSLAEVKKVIKDGVTEIKEGVTVIKKGAEGIEKGIDKKNA